jgi:hypothetical protein
MKKSKELLITVCIKVLCVKIFFSLVLLIIKRFFWSFLKKKRELTIFQIKKKMEKHKKINPSTYFTMSKFKLPFLKKEREKMLHFQTIKEIKLHKKIKPPTHFIMLKFKLKFKTVSKKKKKREC